MGKDSGSERATLGTRLPKDLIERLRESAQDNRRTFQAELEIAVEEYLDRLHNEPELPEELERAVMEYLERHR